MSAKICYITTLPVMLKCFIIDSAEYNMERGGWDITVICNTTPNFQEEIPPGIRYIPVEIRRGISISGIKSTIALYKIFRRERFDLVQYSSSNAGCYASIASRLAKVPIRLYCQWGLDYPAFIGLKKSVFRLIEKVICSCSTNVQPDSKGNLEISIADGLYSSDKGEVVGHGSASGVNLKKFDIAKKEQWRYEIRNRYGISDNVFVLGYVGRLLGDKGINELFAAVKGIKDIDYRLLMVGPTDHAGGITEELLAWAKANDRVIFTGFTTEAEKYYAAMDCFVLPSYHEGFGTSIIEAEAMGTPVIVTDIPGPREAAKKDYTGLFVSAKSVSEIENAIKTMSGNTELRNEFSKNAVKYATEFFNQDFLFEEIYKNRCRLLSNLKLK